MTASIASESVPEEVQTALDKAKIHLMSIQDTVFFTTVLFSLRHLWDSSVPTACTNGYWIRYNPEFFMKQTPAARIGLMLHETFHVIFEHMALLIDHKLDPTKLNYAADYVINLLIKDRGFELPPGALIDEQYRGMHTMEVYHLLPDPDPDESANHFVFGEPSANGTDGQGNPVTVPTPDELKEHIRDILVRAKLQSGKAGDKPGTIPVEIDIYLNRLLNPKLPTATILRKFMFDVAKDDYSWRRPNRRHFPKHILPSQYSEGLGHVVFFADTSASVNDAQFLRMVSEVGGVLKKLKPKKLTLVTFDTRIRNEYEIGSLGQLTRATFTGRGGTAIAPVMEWCNERKPKVALIFTDGGFYFHDSITFPKNPLVWLINDNPNWTAPVGRVITYEMDD